jgi:hypothetical protein
MEVLTSHQLQHIGDMKQLQVTNLIFSFFDHYKAFVPHAIRSIYISPRYAEDNSIFIGTALGVYKTNNAESAASTNICSSIFDSSVNLSPKNRGLTLLNFFNRAGGDNGVYYGSTLEAGLQRVTPNNVDLIIPVEIDCPLKADQRRNKIYYLTTREFTLVRINETSRIQSIIWSQGSYGEYNSSIMIL